MVELSERDLHRTLNVVAVAGTGGNGTPFGLETVDAIAAAIPADDVAYVEWRFGDRDLIRVTRRPEQPSWLQDALAATCDSYPLRDVDHAGSQVNDERDVSILSLLRPHLAGLRSRWERRPHLPSLTERELEVLGLVAQGLTNREISSELFISPATVRTHLEHIYDKLGVRNRAGAVGKYDK
jgi:DNA-binding CsgD family transcriptional regulator